MPIDEATPSAICKKKKFASQIKRAIFVTLFAVIFFLLAYYNEIQFHAEEAQNSIMIVVVYA